MLAGAYPVNFGLAETATAAADPDVAGASGRWAWMPPTSMEGSPVVVGGSSWQTLLSLVVSKIGASTGQAAPPGGHIHLDPDVIPLSLESGPSCSPADA